MSVYLDHRRIALDPAASLGKGGEAEVFDIGGGQALKVFKGPGHPDLAGATHEQAAARQRLDVHQRKLPDFPRGLPDRVIAPLRLATARKHGGRIVGYAMRLVPGAEVFYRYADPGLRRQGISGNRIVTLLRDLRQTVAAVHQAGVVIGDFNDLNVLVAGNRVHLIDADSFQFGPYACAVFTERFVDPLLCDPSAAAPVLASRHTADSDWYAFHVMAMRALLCVGPYGGVHKPADPARRIAHAARPLRRLTIFSSDVVYPKPALHYSLLPDELLDRLMAVFCRDERGPFPAALLDDLRWTRCRRCSAEHARPVCPRCTGAPAGAATASTPTTTIVRGRVRATEIAAMPGKVADTRGTDGTRCVNAAGDMVWASGSQLLCRRAGRPRLLGPEVLGTVLPGRTRLWLGATMGLGFYRVGHVHVAFVFDVRRRGLNDQVELPPVRGTIIAMDCVVGDSRAWLLWREQRGAREIARCALIDLSGPAGPAGTLLAATEADVATATADPASAWLLSARGGAAVGPMLLVPTDAGIVRVEARGGALAVTRSFPDTEPFVCAADRLLAGADGLHVVQRDRILRLTFS